MPTAPVRGTVVDDLWHCCFHFDLSIQQTTFFLDLHKFQLSCKYITYSCSAKHRNKSPSRKVGYWQFNLLKCSHGISGALDLDLFFYLGHRPGESRIIFSDITNYTTKTALDVRIKQHILQSLCSWVADLF